MEKNRIPVLLTGAALTCLTLLLSCGGGGGGDRGIRPAIPYEGVNTPAYITSENAVSLATEAWLGKQYIQQPGDPFDLYSASSSSGAQDSGNRVVSLAGAWEKTAVRYLDRHLPLRAAPLVAIDDTMDGDCWGYADVNGDIDENSGDFDLDVTYHEYSDDCALTINGRSNIKGEMDLYSLSILRMTVTFEAVAASGDGVNVTQSGIWSIDYSKMPTRETLDMVTRDEDTGKTYWMRDWEILTSPVEGTVDTEMTVTGLFYEPDMGYVAFSTEQPLRIYLEDMYPYEGIVILTGADDTGARFQSLSNAAFRVACDEDGDGQYDDYDTGVVHWPGENNPPVAIALDPVTAGRYCSVTLDGSTSHDIDTDPIQSYFWTVVSIPQGSQAVLSDPTSPAPVFVPDVEGEYQFRLIVNDGIDDSVPWAPSCGVSNDELACVLVDAHFGCPYEGLEVFDIGSDPEAVAIGDVNGDGRNDVVMTTGASSDPVNDYKLFVFPQNGAGYLGTPSRYSTAYGFSGLYQSVAVGNLNLDTRKDVVVGSDEGLGIFYQNVSGYLDSMITVSTASCSLLRVGDVNDDDRMDIVCLSGFGTDVTVITQTDTGALDAPVVYSVDLGGYNDLELGDVDDDGLTDVVAMSGQGFGDNIGILLQNGSGTLDPPVYYDLGGDETTNSVGVGDVNGDSRDDVVVTLSGGLRVFYQNVSGTLDSAVSVSTYGHGGPVDVSDIDADGDGDIVSIQTGWQNIEIVRQGAGGTLGAYELYLGPFYNIANPHGLAVGDIDGNGISDVVTAETMYGLVVLHDSVFP